MFRLLQNKRTQYTKNSGNKLSESALWIKQQVVEKARGKKQNPQWAKNMSAIFTDRWPTEKSLTIFDYYWNKDSQHFLHSFNWSLRLTWKNLIEDKNHF